MHGQQLIQFPFGMVEQIRKQNKPDDPLRVSRRAAGTFRIQRRHPIMDDGKIKRFVQLAQDVLFRYEFIHIRKLEHLRLDSR